MLKIKKVHFNDSTYELLKDNCSKSNCFTILVGKNGCGKSRLLRLISNSFAVSDQLLREQPHRWDELTTIPVSSGREYFTYTINGNEIKVNSINENLSSSFESKNISDNYKDSLPKQLICLSTSPFDRFPRQNKYPLNRNDLTVHPSIYTYIGLKDGGKISSVNNLIKSVIQSLLDDPNRIDCNFNIIKDTLSFLGYGNRFRFSVNNYLSKKDLLKIKNKQGVDDLFLTKIKSISDELLHEMRYGNDWGYKRNIISDSILRLSSYLDGQWGKKITFTIKVDSDDNDYGYLVDISRLLNFGILSIDSFKLSQKDDNRRFIDFGEASSGEQCLTLMLLGIAGKIEDNSLICIDEPEISLHPEWQCKFIPLLSSIYNRYQGCHFIIATHSPHITSNLEDDNSYILKMDENKLITSNEYKYKSVDYQLAKIFESPGYNNEYLNRICVKLLCSLSKNGKLNYQEKNEYILLNSLYDKLINNSTLIDLIDVLNLALDALEVDGQ